MSMIFPWKARAGMTLRASTGLEELGHPERMSTPFFYYAGPGDKIMLLDEDYLFNVATYASETDEKYIYSFDYQPNESWTRYNGDLSGDTYRREAYVFIKPTYFRLCLKRDDGGEITKAEGENLNRIVAFRRLPPEPVYRKPPWLENETERVAKRVAALRKSGTLAFALLTDSHYVVNGTWEDTACAVKQMHKHVRLDGVIHLGDLTDGMITAEVAQAYAQKTLGDLRALGVPVHVALGNHDSNYYRNNPEVLTAAAQCELYSIGETPCHIADYVNAKLRFLFLHSFDPAEPIRYGFSEEHIHWLRKTLTLTPDDWQIIVCSHLPPLVKLQYWSNKIRGEYEIMDALESHSRRKGNLLAYLNGHNHTDLLYNGASFPIVSVGCAKLEYFTDKKPEGSVTPPRRRGDATQELWDILLVVPEEKKIDFIRFGAGQDRFIINGKAWWKEE